MALPEGLSRADGMTGVIIFAIVYAIVSIMAKAKEAARKQSGGNPEAEARQQAARTKRRLEERKRQLQQRQQQSPTRTPRPESPPAGNTQAEGARLQDLLRVLTEAAGVPTPEGPMGRGASSTLPSDEDIEERESLETEEQVRNLEIEERRPERREVDFDDEAEAIAQRRIRAAQERDRALGRQDHVVFDQKIRAVPDATRVTRPKLAAMRQAIVWREILGPPLSLRKPSDPEF